ncbi:hypothetical protein [Fodinicola acaciae]|uniref:hypothetical protein n=1 Tax=Fodinicola acaciae TaxID=2681555 RepID=UPI0013D8D164|nr:hypothetical protein [Fodinicola acaciae]
MSGRRRRRTLRGAAVLLALCAFLGTSAGPAVADPSAEPSVAAWSSGPCAGDTGVTVVADFTPFRSGRRFGDTPVVRRCDHGTPATAMRALADVGLDVTRGTDGYLCRITGLPKVADDACTGASGGRPGWALSVPNADRTVWTYPAETADRYHPAAGGVVAFSYGTGTTNQPSVSVAGAAQPASAPAAMDPPTPSGTPGGPSSQSAPAPASAARAATFLADDLRRGGHTFPAAPAGLVADAILALHAAGVAPDEAKAATARLRTQTAADPQLTAKLLLIAVAQGIDPRHWSASGRLADLVRAVAAGVDRTGRYGPDTASQAYGVVALSRAGAAALAVAYLLRQQCPDGGFRATAQGSCASSVDGTAIATWSLAVVGGQDAAVQRAASWLTSHRDSTGGFGVAGSTGLAARALAAAGATPPGAYAGWLGSLQVPAALPTVLRGAIAASPADFAAVKTGLDAYAKSPAGLARLRQTTALAVLGLAAPSARHAGGAAAPAAGSGGRAGASRPHDAAGPPARPMTSLPETGPAVVPMLAIGVLLVLLGVACTLSPGPDPSSELVAWIQRRAQRSANTS